MDILDRLLGHDAWTTRILIERCLTLTDDALDKDHGYAVRTIRATLDHIVSNTEDWLDLMLGRSIISAAEKPRAVTVPELLARHNKAAASLAALAQRVRQDNAFDDLWMDTYENPPIKRTFGGAITHVLTHSMHHRAQLLHMLRLLGLTDLPEGDALSWESQLTN